MNMISVTRLRLRSLRFLPAFALYAARSLRQARIASGNLHAQAVRDRGLVFWTITLWASAEAMRSYRNTGAHLKVMPKLAHWCDEATYLHWMQESATPPTLAEAHARLVAEGIVSRVAHPSPAHPQRAFPAPKM